MRKLSLATTTVFCLSVFAGSVIAERSGLASRDQVTSVNYTHQAAYPAKKDASVGPAISGAYSSSIPGMWSKGAFENWLYFPEGPDGPIFRRMLRWTPDQTGKLCRWLSNADGHYYYHCGKKAVTLSNDPLGSLILPSDDRGMVQFILDTCGAGKGIDFSYDDVGNVLTGRVDHRLPDVAPDFVTMYDYNHHPAEFFDYGWGPDVPLDNIKIHDARDPMHQRGWTYFTVTGKVGAYDITGRGRVPFVYAAYEKHRPWLDASVGGYRIVDTPEQAVLYDDSGAAMAVFPSGAFFSGLGRPWTGIRAYDSTRRDAARERIMFNHVRLGERARVALTRYQDSAIVQINYDIDLAADLIASITFSYTAPASGQMLMGTVAFNFVDNLDDSSATFTVPSVSKTEPCAERPGLAWLFAIAQNDMTLATQPLPLRETGRTKNACAPQ